MLKYAMIIKNSGFYLLLHICASYISIKHCKTCFFYCRPGCISWSMLEAYLDNLCEFVWIEMSNVGFSLWTVSIPKFYRYAYMHTPRILSNHHTYNVSGQFGTTQYGSWTFNLRSSTLHYWSSWLTNTCTQSVWARLLSFHQVLNLFLHFAVILHGTTEIYQIIHLSPNPKKST